MDEINVSVWLTMVLLVVFLIDWMAILLEWKRLKTYTKILAMSMVIIWTLLATESCLQPLVILLLLAQIFGLAGDIFLLLSHKWFLWGLGSFLVGHLFYLYLFGLHLEKNFQFGTKSVWFVVILLVWVCILWGFYRIMKPLSGGKMLWIAIQIYAWVLSGMTAIAFMIILILGVVQWQISLLPIGAFLFLISDSLLAYNQFIKPVNKAQLWVRISYHLAQISLAYGLLTLIQL
jgi:uncharacterized membrane protein YhhN